MLSERCRTLRDSTHAKRLNRNVCGDSKQIRRRLGLQGTRREVGDSQGTRILFQVTKMLQNGLQ